MTAYERQVRAALEQLANGGAEEGADVARKAAAAGEALKVFDADRVAQAMREGMPVELCVAGLVA